MTKHGAGPPRHAWRYSLQEPEAYPGYSPTLIRRTEDWNLAWLSYPYESGKSPPKGFSTAIRRTCQVVLAHGTPDIVESFPIELTLRSMLRMEPIDAVKSIMAYPYLRELPMFQQYGERWLATMTSRIKLCNPDPGQALLSSLDREITDFSDAARLLARF